MAQNTIQNSSWLYPEDVIVYISTAKAEAQINLQAVNAELVDLEKNIATSTSRHNQFLMELGLPPLPGAV